MIPGNYPANHVKKQALKQRIFKRRHIITAVKSRNNKEKKSRGAVKNRGFPIISAKINLERAGNFG
jgi:hypothetical protein